MARPPWEPEGDLPNDPRNFWTVSYGLTTFASLFTRRQLVALTTFSDLAREARKKVLADARAAGRDSDPAPLHEGGRSAAAYADALATYLAFALSKTADYGSAIASWHSSKEIVRNTFARQAIPMTWDFVEPNVFSDSSGNFRTAIGYVADTVANSPAVRDGAIFAIDASKNSFPIRPVVVSTDPPYYDNIGYADLSDFFYVWLRRSLADVWPDLFRRLAAPKDEELVATPYRHGGRDAAEAFFMQGMGQALTAMQRAATEGEPLTIYYAYKQSEIASDAVLSPGWTSFLQAVVDAGLAIDGTWPVRTELSNRMIAKEANVLASSIVLVCRKRAVTAATADRAGLTTALRRELPDAIAKIRAAGVGPVDMQQSVIGPGMGVFTRYAGVLEDDDTAMSVKGALSLINRVWDELDNQMIARLDPETQVALAWFGSYRFEAKPSGELITMANARNTSIDALFESDVFLNLHGRASLTPREQLPRGWRPSTDRNLTIWECVQHTVRALNDAEAGGLDAAARLVIEMGARATDTRALLDRLFRIATEKGWASEALVYNQLAEEWPRLLDRAPAVKPATPDALDLFAAG